MGLVGRLFAILLITVLIEFAIGIFVYERAEHLALREDEARRLAEHLVISRKLVAERPLHERHIMATQLTTDRYDVHWEQNLAPPPRFAPGVERMRQQVVSWEPSLQQSNLRLRLSSPGGHNAIVTGGLQLPDKSWLYFTMKDPPGGWPLTLGRISLTLVPALALVIAGGLLIRRTLTPLRQLALATDRIGHGEEVELKEAGTVEVRNLIRAFNAMQTRIHRLIDDRMQTLAAVGHDLRTPIARLRLRLDSIENDELRDSIETDLAEMGGMVTSLLAYLGGEKDPEIPVSTDIAVTAATIADELADQGRDIRYIGPAHCAWTLRPVAMRRAIGNLVENALNYGQRATLTLAPVGGGLLIRVEDEGPGIPEDRLDDVLHPFTRLDDARQRNTSGLGLGLAIVARAVEREGGTLSLRNREQGGLSAEIRLPAPAQPAPSPHPKPSPRP